MAFDVGSIVAKLQLDKKGWDAAVQKVKSDQTAMSKFAQAHGESLKKMGRSMTIAGGIIVGGLGMMVKKASEAQETFAKFDTVFQDVLPEAAEDAKNLAKNFGLSELAAKDLLSQTGDLLTGLGLTGEKALGLSNQTQQLAVDLASFTNYSGGAKGASDALTKAMLGERESVKALGIVITEEMVKERLLLEGKKELKGAALMQAKAEATLAIAMSQSKNAIGDYARTSDSLANQQRLLKSRFEDLTVTIGTQLIPVVTNIVTKVSGAIEKFTAWTKENPKLTETIVKVAAALGGALLVLGPLLVILPKLIKMAGLVRHAIMIMTGPWGIVIAVVAAATAAVAKLIITLGQLKKAKEYLEDATLREAEALKRMGDKLREIADVAGLTGEEFDKLSKKYNGNVNALALAIKKGEEGVELQKAMAKVGAQNVAQQKKATEATEDGTDALEDFNKKLEDTAKALKAKEEAEKKAREETERWVEIMDAVRGKTIPETRKEIAELELALKKLDKEYKAGLLTISQYNKSTKETKQKIKELTAEITLTALPAARDMSEVWKEVPGVMEDVAFVSDEMAEQLAEDARRIALEWQNAASMIAAAFLDTFYKLKKEGTATIEDFANTVGSLIGGLISDIPIIGQVAAFTISNLLAGISEHFTGTQLAKDIEAFEQRVEEQHEATIDAMETLQEKAEATKNTAKSWAESFAKLMNMVEKSTSRTGDDLIVAVEKLDDAFTTLLGKAKEFGREGSKEMVDFIKATREAGLEIPSVTAYVVEQLDKIPAAMNDLGWAAEDVGKLAVHTFESMAAAGVPYLDIVQKMSPAIADLKKKYEEQGLVASAALQRMFDIVDITEANKELFTALEANNTVLQALGNSANMSQEMMTLLAGDAYNLFHNLQTAGMTSDEALRAMAPNLQQIVNAAAAHGLILDENVQKIIDEAMALGLITEAQETEAAQQERIAAESRDAMKTGFESLAKTIEEAFTKAFGISFDNLDTRSKESAKRFRSEWKEASDAAAEGMGGMQPEGPGPTPGTEPARPIRGLATGGYIPNPTLAYVAEKVPEFVTDVPQMAAIMTAVAGAGAEGGGGGKEINITLNVASNFEISALDPSTMRDVVRNQIAPEFIDFIETNLPKKRLQEALGVT